MICLSAHSQREVTSCHRASFVLQFNNTTTKSTSWVVLDLKFTAQHGPAAGVIPVLTP